MDKQPIIILHKWDAENTQGISKHNALGSGNKRVFPFFISRLNLRRNVIDFPVWKSEK